MLGIELFYRTTHQLAEHYSQSFLVGDEQIGVQIAADRRAVFDIQRCDASRRSLCRTRLVESGATEVRWRDKTSDARCFHDRRGQRHAAAVVVVIVGDRFNVDELCVDFHNANRSVTVDLA